MGLFDIFTNDASEDAYGRNNTYIMTGIDNARSTLKNNNQNAMRLLGIQPGQNAVGMLNQGYGQAQGALSGGFDRAQGVLNGMRPDLMGALNQGGQAARGALNQGFGDAAQAVRSGYGQAGTTLRDMGRDMRGTINQGAQRSRQDLRGGYADASQALRGGYQDARSDLTQVARSYNPMIQGGRSAFNAFLDASGANGASGSARAQDNFRVGPGYQFQMEQGTDQIARMAAARGQLAGGNTDVDLLKYSQGLADQEFDDYADRLQAGAAFYNQGLAGRGAALGARANAAQTYGQNAADLASNRGTALSNLGQSVTGQRVGVQQAVGTGQAALQQGRANQLSTIEQNQGTAASALEQSLMGQRMGTINNLGRMGVDLATQQGTQAANLAAQQGTGLANIYNTGAAGYQNLGTNLANTNIQGMNANISNSNALAQSENQQSANLWGGIMSAAGTLAAPMTGGASSALSNTLGGSLFNSASSGLSNMFAPQQLPAAAATPAVAAYQATPAGWGAYNPYSGSSAGWL